MANSKHDRNVVPRITRLVSPIIEIPLGLQDVAYDGEFNLANKGLSGPMGGLSSAPKNLTIVSQTVRLEPGGGYVVDVVVEFDEVPGAASYEARTSIL